MCDGTMEAVEGGFSVAPSRGALNTFSDAIHVHAGLAARLAACMYLYVLPTYRLVAEAE
jgi:hypothetical protein